MVKNYCDVCGQEIDPADSLRMTVCNTNIWHADKDRAYQLCKRCARKVKKFMTVIQKQEANHAK